MNTINTVNENAADNQRFEGEVSVCAHRVAFRYWGFSSELTPGLEEALEEAAEERAQELVAQGYVEGQLNCFWTDEDNADEEISGWWEIIKD